MAEKSPDQEPSKVTFKRADIAPEKITFGNRDGSPLRDMDNAAPEPKPQFATKPRNNLAPPGAVGIQTKEQNNQREAETPSQPPKEAGLALDGGGRDGGPWVEGRIVTMKGYEFQAKVYNEPSQHGIDGGKISKLEVRKDGDIVMNYDRGWDMKPSTPEQKEALHRIRNGLDAGPQKQFKGFEQTPDKGHGWER